MQSCIIHVHVHVIFIYPIHAHVHVCDIGSMYNVFSSSVI